MRPGFTANCQFKVRTQARVGLSKSREGEEEGTNHEGRVQLTVVV